MTKRLVPKLASQDVVADPSQRHGVVQSVGGRGGSRFAWVRFSCEGTITMMEKWPVRRLRKIGQVIS